MLDARSLKCQLCQFCDKPGDLNPASCIPILIYMQGAPDLTVTLTKQPQIYLLVGEVGFVKQPHNSRACT